MMSFEDYYDLVESEIQNWAQAAGSDLRAAMAYSLRVGGKRWRPVLCLAGFDLRQGRKSSEFKNEHGHNSKQIPSTKKYEKALPVALAIEMMHTYSLIQDDLPAMDDDGWRRGKPTSHTIYGEAGAILASDGLLTEAFQLLIKHAQTIKNDTDRIRILSVFETLSEAIGKKGMLWGQWLDLLMEGKIKNGSNELQFNSTENKEQILKEIHRHKTGDLITASLMSGAILSGANENELAAIQTFGDNLGLSFQITDDILDETASSAELGKTVGKDKNSQKLTFPAIYGLEESRLMAQAATETGTKALIKQFGSQQSEFLCELAQKQLTRQK